MDEYSRGGSARGDEKMDVQKCEQLVEESLENDQVKKLYEAILDKMKFSIECKDCRGENGAAGTFARAYFSAAHLEDTDSKVEPSVVLCVNALPDQGQVLEALTHEMVHAYDHCVARRDLTACEELACSEVRAAREAECRDNFNGGPGELCRIAGVDPFENDTSSTNTLGKTCRWFKKRCAAQNAVKSVEAVFPGKGSACVAKVLDRCYRDIHPFEVNDEVSDYKEERQ